MTVCFQRLYDQKRNIDIYHVSQDVDNRRSQLVNHYVSDNTEQNEAQRINKAKTRHTEIEVKRHEDRLQDLEVQRFVLYMQILFYFDIFKNCVVKNEDLEYELRKSVKEAEFQRRKKEQEVQRLKEDLIRKKREDAKKIQEAIARSEKEEREIERHLAKEKAKLDKVRI